MSGDAIYALVDPRTDEVRYVGFSSQPEIRFQQHLQRRNSNPEKAAWIARLASADLRPRMVVLQELTADDDWGRAERRWIDQLQNDGHRLTDIRSGGESISQKVARCVVVHDDDRLVEQILERSIPFDCLGVHEILLNRAIVESRASIPALLTLMSEGGGKNMRRRTFDRICLQLQAASLLDFVALPTHVFLLEVA